MFFRTAKELMLLLDKIIVPQMDNSSALFWLSGFMKTSYLVLNIYYCVFLIMNQFSGASTEEEVFRQFFKRNCTQPKLHNSEAQLKNIQNLCRSIGERQTDIPYNLFTQISRKSQQNETIRSQTNQEHFSFPRIKDYNSLKASSRDLSDDKRPVETKHTTNAKQEEQKLLLQTEKLIKWESLTHQISIQSALTIST